jgi:hypothetical protein
LKLNEIQGVFLSLECLSLVIGGLQLRVADSSSWLRAGDIGWSESLGLHFSNQITSNIVFGTGIVPRRSRLQIGPVVLFGNEGQFEVREQVFVLNGVSEGFSSAFVDRLEVLSPQLDNARDLRRSVSAGQERSFGDSASVTQQVQAVFNALKQEIARERNVVLAYTPSRTKQQKKKK